MPTYPVRLVAGLIVSRCRRRKYPLTLTKLQAMLLFVQMQFIKETGKVCFNEIIYAGKDGPMISAINDRVAKKSSGPVTQEVLEKLFPTIHRMERGEMEILSRTVDSAGLLSEQTLIEMILKQQPFKNGLASESKRILPDEINAFFTD